MFKAVDREVRQIRISEKRKGNDYLMKNDVPAQRNATHPVAEKPSLLRLRAVFAFGVQRRLGRDEQLDFLGMPSPGCNVQRCQALAVNGGHPCTTLQQEMDDCGALLGVVALRRLRQRSSASALAQPGWDGRFSRLPQKALRGAGLADFCSRSSGSCRR